MEPTAGLIETRSIWNGAGQALDLADGNDLRIQAGSRFGNTFEWGRTPVEATLTLLAYDHVSITGGTLLVATSGLGTGIVAPTDEGKVIWAGDLKAELRLEQRHQRTIVICRGRGSRPCRCDRYRRKNRRAILLVGCKYASGGDFTVPSIGDDPNCRPG